MIVKRFWAICALILLWVLFFWRLFTPNAPDALSVKEGDFSGQFVSWTAYSVERIGNGELPLWNPYMHAGAPFLADPQTAVLYPPRLLTVFILSLGATPKAGTVYFALQTEMTLHILFGLLGMYAFLRRLTASQPKDISTLGSFIGAITFAFGGFLQSYPLLQLPILETAVWTPYILLGLHEATRTRVVGWHWLGFSSLMLALAVLAGHPQTLLFVGYLSAAYLAYRLRQQQIAWRPLLAILGVFVVIAIGLAAIQLLPTAAFQRETYRNEIHFAEKGNGFAFQDVLQFVFYGMLGYWTPLYVGLVGILLVGMAIWRRVPLYAFWTGVGAVGLLLSFGEKLVGYDILYLLLPGFSLFRGQERTAFLVNIAGSVLVCLGVIHLLTWETLTDHKATRQFQRATLAIIALCGVASMLFFYLRVQPPDGELYQDELNSAVLALGISVTAYFVLRWVLHESDLPKARIALLVLMLVDLFSATMPSFDNYDAIKASDRIPEPAYIEPIRQNLDEGQRVEGLVGIPMSYGALFTLPDIWGNSPLRYDTMEFFLWQVPIERRWELLAVQVVNSENPELPVANTKIGEGTDIHSKKFFHSLKLADPRPFAHMVYQVTKVNNRAEARGLVKELSYPARDAVLLEGSFPDLPTTEGTATVTIDTFAPEHLTFDVQTNTPGILTLALPYTEDWQATVDGKDAGLLRAYGGLSAVYVPAGSYEVELYYRPWSFRYGMLISGISLLGLIGLVVWGKR